MKAALIVIGIVVVLGIIAVGSLIFLGKETVKEINKSMGVAATSDYKVTDVECLTDDTSGLKATGKIKNLSNKAQAFHVTVRWETTSGDLIGVDSTYTDKLDVGQSQLWSTTSFEDVPQGATAKCNVSKVEYTIFGN